MLVSAGWNLWKLSFFAPADSVSASPRAQSRLSPRLFFPACFFLLTSRPSIFLARNLARGCMQKVHRLVMYFLRYIKPYILWNVRITAAAEVTYSTDMRYRLRRRERARVGYEGALRRHANNVQGVSEWLMWLRGLPLTQAEVINPSLLNYA